MSTNMFSCPDCGGDVVCGMELIYCLDCMRDYSPQAPLPGAGVDEAPAPRRVAAPRQADGPKARAFNAEVAPLIEQLGVACMRAGISGIVAFELDQVDESHSGAWAGILGPEQPTFQACLMQDLVEIIDDVLDDGGEAVNAPGGSS